jgi:hypothetical protein
LMFVPGRSCACVWRSDRELTCWNVGASTRPIGWIYGRKPDS